MATKKAKKKSNAGRKSKYDPETFPKLAEEFARQGMIDLDIIKALGISHTMFYTYQNRHPEFKEALKRGKAPVNIEVENALLKAARGYIAEEVQEDIRVDKDGNEVIYNKVKKKKEVPSNITACIFWLKNRKPEVWRDKVEADVNVKGDIKVSFDKEDEDL